MNDENKMKISYSEKLSNQNRKCNSGWNSCQVIDLVFQSFITTN